MSKTRKFKVGDKVGFLSSLYYYRVVAVHQLDYELAIVSLYEGDIPINDSNSFFWLEESLLVAADEYPAYRKAKDAADAAKKAQLLDFFRPLGVERVRELGNDILPTALGYASSHPGDFVYTVQLEAARKVGSMGMENIGNILQSECNGK